jgi:uncharacterized protein
VPLWAASLAFLVRFLDDLAVLDRSTYRLDDIEKILRRRNLLKPLDILLVGATGVGKSSTLNAIFGKTVAQVGESSRPETKGISANRLHEFLRFHDSAGLGDSVTNDALHAMRIKKLLNRETQAIEDVNYAYIDLVLIVLDAASRDLGTTYKLLIDVVLTNISSSRVAVIINRSDIAMSGKGWNKIKSQPTDSLIDFLDEKAEFLRIQLEAASGSKIQRPVYYSASSNYNVEKVIDLLINIIPQKRRTIF